MKYLPFEYQEFGEAHILEHRGTGLFLEMGLGKTVMALSAVVKMIKTGAVKKTLIIAPLHVARDTWPDEIEKWDHTRHLRVSKVLGSETNRKKALMEKADVWIINRENVPWLVAFFGLGWPFDCVIIDELSSFKSAKSRRFKTLRMVLSKINRVVGLTGTPMPNSLIDLWSQLYLLDNGERLGGTLTQYRTKYFTPDKSNGFIVYSYRLKTGEELMGTGIYAKEIYDKISDICISMKQSDYVKLPEKIIRTRQVYLSAEIKAMYDEFEEEQVLKLLDDKELTAANAAVLTGKLLQFSNGAVYDENRDWHKIHDEKLDALTEILEDTDSPVLIFYAFKHDLARMKSKIKGLRELKTSQDIKDWNSGKVPVMAAHPASAGHGLNLQAGGNVIIWFGLTWSLELYLQANARLHRQGQLKPVIIHHLICPGTMDTDVLKVLTKKTSGQEALMSAVKARVAKYKNLLS